MGNEEKDRMAERVMERVLGEGVWRNVVWLHQGVAVYEVREGRGWGMRWTLDLEEGEQEGDRGEVNGGGGSGEQGRETGTAVGVSGEGEEATATATVTAAREKQWRITKTTFRGFLEPIERLDHELPNG